jgi:hypothetical protein
LCHLLRRQSFNQHVSNEASVIGFGLKVERRPAAHLVNGKQIAHVVLLISTASFAEK